MWLGNVNSAESNRPDMKGTAHWDDDNEDYENGVIRSIPHWIGEISEPYWGNWGNL